MFPILEEDLQKEYEILTILDSEDRWWISAELAQAMNVSPRTVRGYLYSLIDHLKAWPRDAIFIDIQANHGIRLTKTWDFNIRQVYSQFARGSLLFNLLDHLFYEKINSVVEFCLENYTSTSSFYRKMAPLKELAKKFNLRLKLSIPRLEGEETQIRYFYYTIYREIYRGEEWPFKNINRDQLYRRFQHISTFFHYELTESETEQMLYWGAVNLTRLSKGHVLTQTQPFEFLTCNNPFYQASSSVLGQLYGDDVPVAEAEKQFLFAIIHAFPYMDALHPHLFWTPDNGQERLPYIATETWLRQFQQVFGRNSILESTTLKARLNRIHCHAILFAGWSDLLERFSFLNNLEETYPLFYDRLSLLYALLLISDEAAYFADRQYLFPRYALLCSEYFDLTSYEEPIAISLATDYGTLYEGKIKKEIKNRFTETFNIYFTTSAEETCDLLLTNIPNFSRQPQLPLLNIREAFNEREWATLQQALANIRAKKSMQARAAQYMI